MNPKHERILPGTFPENLPRDLPEDSLGSLPGNLAETLQGRCIWVTRPQGQAARLMALLQQAGARAFHFPVIEIRALENKAQAARALRALDGYYALIFISRNAVTHALRLVPALAASIGSAAVIAVGASTQEALSEHGFSAVIVSAEGSGSEALLRLPLLQAQSVEGRQIMILRGQGGRELLKERLAERGAQVAYTELYRRTLPRLDRLAAKKLWQQHRPDVIVVTSIEGLHNLIKLINKAQHEELFNTPLLAPGGRIQTQAERLGFAVLPYNDAAVSDAALVQALVQALVHGVKNR